MIEKLIPIYRCSDKMPDPFAVVIVSGGIAAWTGSKWISRTAGSNGMDISWAVLWWSPLVYLTEEEAKLVTNEQTKQEATC